ncbi:hypothetical protein D0B54_04075 [Solimonas sp. K1W22B-7]|uniref:hypothetical protein n=1 Tax=Solimonas sp. K1W22B-7 TaxID=2303331 RepID=UPI000E334A05|nr:hypothetical protein [Solimonas sp. K1W22B-7]AXQ27901.1 hypothetical protein D0B54_04075 [Solimonas sp. K1W22B-7]
MTRRALFCAALLLVQLPLHAEDLESEVLAERSADIDVGGVSGLPAAEIEAGLLSNRVLIEQAGSDHYAMVDQSGRDNYASIQQAGTGASALIVQSGSGNFAVVQQR